MPRPSDQQVRDGAALHDALQAWLLAHHAQTPLPVVVAALSYELARLISGPWTTDDAERDAVLSGVVDTMREQIAAHRDGRLPPV